MEAPPPALRFSAEPHATTAGRLRAEVQGGYRRGSSVGRAAAPAAGRRFESCPRLRIYDDMTAAPTYARSSEDRALPCDGSGRWFDSSRAYRADVAQTEEHRVASPGRPVRSGSSRFEGLWCKRQHDELQPRRSGFEPWRACFLHDFLVAGRSGSVIWVRAVARTCAVAVRLRVPTAPHDRDDTLCCGPTRSGYRLLIDRSRVRVPPGAFRAPVAQLAEQFRVVPPRPQQSIRSDAGCGPERNGSLVERPAAAGRSAGSIPPGASAP